MLQLNKKSTYHLPSLYRTKITDAKRALPRKWPQKYCNKWYYLAVIKVMINKSYTIGISLTQKAEEISTKATLKYSVYRIITPKRYSKSQIFDKSEQKTIFKCPLEIILQHKDLWVRIFFPIPFRSLYSFVFVQRLLKSRVFTRSLDLITYVLYFRTQRPWEKFKNEPTIFC